MDMEITMHDPEALTKPVTVKIRETLLPIPTPWNSSLQ